MTTMASQTTSLTVVYSYVYSEQIKENIKVPRHWPLCGEFTGTGEFPAQRASYAENVSIWWRHHVTDDFLCDSYCFSHLGVSRVEKYPSQVNSPSLCNESKNKRHWQCSVPCNFTRHYSVIYLHVYIGNHTFRIIRVYQNFPYKVLFERKNNRKNGSLYPV